MHVHSATHHFKLLTYSPTDKRIFPFYPYFFMYVMEYFKVSLYSTVLLSYISSFRRLMIMQVTGNSLILSLLVIGRDSAHYVVCLYSIFNTNMLQQNLCT